MGQIVEFKHGWGYIANLYLLYLFSAIESIKSVVKINRAVFQFSGEFGKSAREAMIPVAVIAVCQINAAISSVRVVFLFACFFLTTIFQINGTLHGKQYNARHTWTTKILPTGTARRWTWPAPAKN